MGRSERELSKPGLPSITLRELTAVPNGLGSLDDLRRHFTGIIIVLRSYGVDPFSLAASPGRVQAVRQDGIVGAADGFGREPHALISCAISFRILESCRPPPAFGGKVSIVAVKVTDFDRNGRLDLDPGLFIVDGQLAREPPATAL